MKGLPGNLVPLKEFNRPKSALTLQQTGWQQV